MEKPTYIKRRCEHCKNWTIGNVFQCENCSEIIDKETRKRRLEFAEKLRKEREKVEAELALPPMKRGFKKFLRILETIYLAFISFIAYLLFWLGG